MCASSVRLGIVRFLLLIVSSPFLACTEEQRPGVTKPQDVQTGEKSTDAQAAIDAIDLSTMSIAELFKLEEQGTITLDRLTAELARRLSKDENFLTAVTGPAGLVGDDGRPGRDGKDGGPGPAGETGEPGRDSSAGQDGLPGLPGESGHDGLDGAPGPRGEKGDPGEPGLNAPTVEAVRIVSLPPLMYEVSGDQPEPLVYLVEAAGGQPPYRFFLLDGPYFSELDHRSGLLSWDMASYFQYDLPPPETADFGVVAIDAGGAIGGQWFSVVVFGGSTESGMDTTDDESANDMGLPGLLDVAITPTGQTACYDVSADVVDCAVFGGREPDCGQPPLSYCGQDGQYAQSVDGRYLKTGSPMGAEVVTDTFTGLVWAEMTMCGRTFDQAVLDCAALEYGDHDDWRLPTVHQLASIVDYGRFGDALDPIFEQPCAWTHWAINTFPGYPHLAWYIYFLDGRIGFIENDEEHTVRCVRP